MKDFSKDGRVCIDAMLQVFEVKSGKLLTSLNRRKNVTHDFAMVRLTYDGQYAIWADELYIHTARINDNQLVGSICTHEKPLTMMLFDFGYTVVIGREDGHILTAKLIDGESNLPPGFRPETARERLNAILGRIIYPDGIVSTFEQYYQTRAKPLTDQALPKMHKDIQSSLVDKAKVPHAVIKTVYKTSSFGDLKELERDFKKRRGSTPNLFSVVDKPPDIDTSTLDMLNQSRRSGAGGGSVSSGRAKCRLRGHSSVSDFFLHHTTGRQKAHREKVPSVSDIFTAQSSSNGGGGGSKPTTPTHTHSSSIMMTLSDFSGGVGKIFKRMTSDSNSNSVTSSPMIARRSDPTGSLMVDVKPPRAKSPGKHSPKLRKSKSASKAKPPKIPPHNNTTPRRKLPGTMSLDADECVTSPTDVGRSRFFSDSRAPANNTAGHVEDETCVTKL